MVYNFEKIIIESMAKKYGLSIEKDFDEQTFELGFIYEYRSILDKLFRGVVKELIESEQLYKIMMNRLTLTERLSIILFYFFDLSAEEIAKATFTSVDSVHSERNKGIKKIRQALNIKS